jgi:signal transduction histidine kinase
MPREEYDERPSGKLLSLSNRFVRNVKRAVLFDRFAYSDLVRRVHWQLLAAAFLIILLAVLATLQYRWLGDVSEAGRERMRASLRTRASEFAQEFDGELTRTYVAFRVDGDRLDADPATALADTYARWQSSETRPELVRGVYLAEGRTFDSAQVRRFDPDRRVLESVRWPPDIADALTRVPRFLPHPAGAVLPMLFTDAVDAHIPALMIAVPHVTRATSGQQITVVTDPTAAARVVVVALDAGRLRRQLLEPLVTKYFGAGDASEYLVTIVARDDPSTVIYGSDKAPVDAAAADVKTGLFDLRMDDLNRLMDERAGSAGSGPWRATSPVPADTKPRVAITIVRRANGPDGTRVLMAGGDERGAWEVRVGHRSGSLEAIVTRSRRRNLAISLGVLGLLGASVILVMAAAQRQHRLAAQQMEFVAAVSHELRTPLAVICSAGENLADGVVADGAQVKRYGSLIETEGRRLSDMVERVMEFAGISSGAPVRAHSDVDVSKVIAGAVSGVGADALDRGITITVHPNGALPLVTGDADALRSAVQNIVANAVKYSPDGGAVDVTMRAHNGGVQIRVADRGLGIDAADLPHIFKPFYRGRRAVDAQVRGTGVGLTVVKHVVDAHHATIAVGSRVGEGTTVTMELLPAVLPPRLRLSDSAGPLGSVTE